MSETRLPEHGWTHERVLRRMEELAHGDADWRSGRTWSLVYHAGEEHTRFLKEAYGRFFSENGLNPMAFRSLKRFETEVVGITAGLLHGGSEAVGLLTSGGTESILLAVKCYRDRARRRLRLPGRPVIVAPESVHPAFEKAAAYFDVRIAHAPLLPDFRVDPRAVRRLIDRRTILVVASAPCYPFGVVDPVGEVAEIASRRGIPVHVDACVGGFLLPFVEKLGRSVPAWDFRVPGVCSISADVHKYGYAAKGASVLLYRSMEIMRHQLFAYTDWCGGVFASAGLLGTRPGGAMAAAWAALHALGEDGYLALCRQVLDTTRRLQEGIRAIPELEVLGDPPASVFAFRSRSESVSIFVVGDLLEKRGWHVDRQQRPHNLHAMVTPAHADAVEAYLGDLRAAVEEAKRNPALASQGGAAAYGLMAGVPLRGMVKRNVLKLMEAMYGPEGRLPDLTDSSVTDDPMSRLALKALPWIEKARGLWRKLNRRG